MIFSSLLLVVSSMIGYVRADYSVSSVVQADLNWSGLYWGSTVSETHVSPTGAAFQDGTTTYGGNSPTFFTGLIMSESNDARNGATGVNTMKVTVTITDSSGTSVSSIQIGNQGMLNSPQSSGIDWSGILVELYNSLNSLCGLAKIPCPSISLQNGALYTGACGQNNSCDSSTVWAQWNRCTSAVCSPNDVPEEGMTFRYQPVFSHPDVYTVTVTTSATLIHGCSACGRISVGPVTSSYSFQYVYENDANSGNDAGGTFSTALGVPLGSYNGLLYGADTVDMYKFDGTAGQTYYFTVVPPVFTIGSSVVSDVRVSIYDPGWNLVVGSNLGPGQTNKGSFTASSTGSYYMNASLNNGGGIYQFAISNQPNTLLAPDFGFSSSPNPAVFDPNALAGSSTITAGSINSFTGTISLSFTVSPSMGANCALSQTSISLASPGSFGSVNLLCGESTLQTYTITLTGTAGRLSHTITIPFMNQSPSSGGCTSSNCPKHT